MAHSGHELTRKLIASIAALIASLSLAWIALTITGMIANRHVVVYHDGSVGIGIDGSMELSHAGNVGLSHDGSVEITHNAVHTPP